MLDSLNKLMSTDIPIVKSMGEDSLTFKATVRCTARIPSEQLGSAISEMSQPTLVMCRSLESLWQSFTWPSRRWSA